MEIAQDGAEVLHLEEVANLIDSWRSEVTQGPPHKVNRATLQGLFERWEDVGLEAVQLAFVLLGAEWLFRARLATGDDVRREILRMRASLCNPRRGPLEADQAAVLIDTLEPTLTRKLSQWRFLVSLEQWAVRGPLTRWETWGTAKSGGPTPGPVPQVKRKRGGRIPLLAPIVAGVVAEAIAGAACSAEEAEALGISVAEWLLGRSVPTGEFRRWRGKLDLARLASDRTEPSPVNPPSLRAWFARRFRLGFSNGFTHKSWDTLIQRASREPRRCFDLIASSGAVSALYSMSWAGGYSNSSAPTPQRLPN